MGNSLGGTIFIVFGILGGYLIITGRMQKWLTGGFAPPNTQQQTTPTTPTQPIAPITGPSQSGGGIYMHGA